MSQKDYPSKSSFLKKVMSRKCHVSKRLLLQTDHVSKMSCLKKVIVANGSCLKNVLSQKGHVSKRSCLKKVIVANRSCLKNVMSQKGYFCKVIMSQKGHGSKQVMTHNDQVLQWSSLIISTSPSAYCIKKMILKRNILAKECFIKCLLPKSSHSQIKNVANWSGSTLV